MAPQEHCGYVNPISVIFSIAPHLMHLYDFIRPEEDSNLRGTLVPAVFKTAAIPNLAIRAL